MVKKMKRKFKRGYPFLFKSKKRAQLKIQQMAFMLIAVTLFFLFAGLFLAMIIFADVKQAAEIIEERDALLLVSKLSNSPEFSCGNAFGGFRINCIDLDKAMSLKKNIVNYQTYRGNFWGIDGIEIYKIYPKESQEECTENNYPHCSRLRILQSTGGIGVSNFVALCRKESLGGIIRDKCEIGRVIIYYRASQETN